MLNRVRCRGIFRCLWVFGPIISGVANRKSGEGRNVCRRVFSAESAGFWVVRGFLAGMWVVSGLNWGLLEVKWGLCNCRKLITQEQDRRINRLIIVDRAAR